MRYIDVFTFDHVSFGEITSAESQKMTDWISATIGHPSEYGALRAHGQRVEFWRYENRFERPGRMVYGKTVVANTMPPLTGRLDKGRVFR